MLDLITQTACIKKLNEDGYRTSKGTLFTKHNFSPKVKEGAIPHHKKPNSRVNWFKYDEVVQVFETFTNTAHNKSETAKEYEDDSLLAQAGSFPSVADMSSEEISAKLEKEAKERDEAKAQAEAAGVDIDNPETEESEELTFLGKSLHTVKIQKEFWLGKKAEAEYKRQMQDLVSIDEVNKNAFEVARSVRDSLTGMSARLTAMVASENDPHIIRTMIDEEVNRTLSSVSEAIYE